MVREIVFWERGAARFDEQVVTDNPIRFGGRAIQFRDSLGALPPSEAAFPGLVEILIDEQVVSKGQEAMIRPGRRDIGRYHLWITAGIFRDRRTGSEDLWLGRRIESKGSARAYEIIRINQAGRLSTDRVALRQRADSYPLYRTVQFLSDESPTVYWGSLGNVWPNIIVPVFYPWIVFVFGLLFVVVGWRSSRKLHKSQSAIGLTSG